MGLSSHAAEPQETNKQTAKPSAEKMVMLRSAPEWKATFSYFPYPLKPYGMVPTSATGVFRISINHEGKVTEINVVRSTGPILNACAIKALVRWRAKPGAPQVVGIAFHYSQF
jgi:TonB family protein